MNPQDAADRQKRQISQNVRELIVTKNFEELQLYLNNALPIDIFVDYGGNRLVPGKAKMQITSFDENMMPLCCLESVNDPVKDVPTSVIVTKMIIRTNKSEEGIPEDVGDFKYVGCRFHQTIETGEVKIKGVNLTEILTEDFLNWCTARSMALMFAADEEEQQQQQQAAQVRRSPTTTVVNAQQQQQQELAPPPVVRKAPAPSPAPAPAPSQPQIQNSNKRPASNGVVEDHYQEQQSKKPKPATTTTTHMTALLNNMNALFTTYKNWNDAYGKHLACAGMECVANWHQNPSAMGEEWFDLALKNYNLLAVYLSKK